MAELTPHPEDDICCLCSDPDYFEVVEQGRYPGVTAHAQWSEALCPYAAREIARG